MTLSYSIASSRLFLMGGLTALVSTGTPRAAAQTTIVELRWTSGQSAGPRAQNYPPDQDAKDIWAGDDFQTDRRWAIGRFTSWGSGIGGATDVLATIYDDIPTVGKVVMQSVPGAGKYVRSGSWGYYETNFGGQALSPGKYWIIWQADGNPSTITPVMFVQHGAYTVGAGTPDNGHAYNPGGFWNLPEGPWTSVTDQLAHMGNPIGVNFKLEGTELTTCPADFNGDGFVNGDDFDAFSSAFAAGDATADFDKNGFVTGDDFDAYVAAFEAGC